MRPTSRGVTNASTARSNVYLDRPLQDRHVIDVETGAALPLFVPSW
jgi:hypothetical protein